MRLFDLGDRALVVQYSQPFSLELNDRIRAEADALKRKLINGVLHVRPEIDSIFIRYDPDVVSRSQILEWISASEFDSHVLEGDRRLTIPICYDGEHGPDLDALADLKGVTAARIIEWHGSCTYRVLMTGFLPGFGYLGLTPDELHTPRMDSPRKRVPEGSVAIADGYTGIYPIASPGGWHILGRTPVPMISNSPEKPFLLRTGDTVAFRRIDEAEFDGLRRLHENGMRWEELYD